MGTNWPRGLALWMARATTSLPVPLSPSSRTGRRLLEAFSMSRRTAPICADVPTSEWRPVVTGHVMHWLSLSNLVAPRSRVELNRISRGYAAASTSAPSSVALRAHQHAPQIRAARPQHHAAPSHNGRPSASRNRSALARLRNAPTCTANSAGATVCGTRITSRRTAPMPGPIRSMALRRRVRKVDDASIHEGTAVDDANIHAFLVVQVIYPHPGVERQRAMRRHQLLHVVDLAVGGRPPVIGMAIPTRHAGLQCFIRTGTAGAGPAAVRASGGCSRKLPARPRQGQKGNTGGFETLPRLCHGRRDSSPGLSASAALVQALAFLRRLGGQPEKPFAAFRAAVGEKHGRKQPLPEALRRPD